MQSGKRALVLTDCIQRCKNLKSFEKVHAHLITSGLVSTDSVLNKAVDFFINYPVPLDYPSRFLIQWGRRLGTASLPFNRLISGYAGSHTPNAAVLAYAKLVRDGFSPDMFTFPALLKSCAKFVGIGEGRQVHGVVLKMGFVGDVYVQNCLVHFYAVCGDCGGAGRVFDEMLLRDVVSWTGIISGYVKAGFFDEAVAVFLRMDVRPNLASFVTVLVACGREGYLNVGRGIHVLVFKHGLGLGLEVSNALMDMYVKCECFREARLIFDELTVKDIISWTIVITGLVQCKRPRESLELFSDMKRSGVEPDGIILTCVLSACASLGAPDYGRWVHEYIDRMGIKRDVQIGTAMVDMYAKCGCIEMALQVFNGMAKKNVLSWNALLNGLAMNGHGREALQLFEEMIEVGMRPNEVTFLSILTACCHAGLVDEGRRYFNLMMSEHYSLSPRLEHYGCMVDLLCRAGLLDEALKLVNSMPMTPDVLIMGALLSACKTTGNVKLSRKILDGLVALESSDSGVYVLLSNIYATNQRWADVTRLRRLMKEKGIKKAPGSSVVEVDGKAHEFLVGDNSHRQNEDIHTLLKLLTNEILFEGHRTHPFLT